MTIETVKEYYGKTLTGSGDLKTDACCDASAIPEHVKAALSQIHDEVLTRYYGCGLVIPEKIEGMRILDLGCGAGRDAYALAKLAGPEGHVTGVDMTPEQLAVARKHVGWHMERFGHAATNIDFREGYIEELEEPRPRTAELRHHRLELRGEPLARQARCTRRRARPAEARRRVLFRGCLCRPATRRGPSRGPGAARRMSRRRALLERLPEPRQEAGFGDPRLVRSRPIEVTEPSIRRALGNARFFSATYRLFNIDGLEPACEDYGQAVIYRGGIAHAEGTFALDGHHEIEKGRTFPVCGNTFRMLRESRFAPHFDFIGDFSRHFGIFPGCGTAMPYADEGGTAGPGACC